MYLDILKLSNEVYVAFINFFFYVCVILTQLL